MLMEIESLQGRVRFPTGGKVRERKLNRCDSGTDSTVWMKEEQMLSYFVALMLDSGRFFVLLEDFL